MQHTRTVGSRLNPEACPARPLEGRAAPGAPYLIVRALAGRKTSDPVMGSLAN